MTKNEFLDCLASHLEGLSQADIDRSMEFYGEMIDDRIDEGEDEQTAWTYSPLAAISPSPYSNRGKLWKYFSRTPI